MFKTLSKNKFLFEELVKRDFKKKYKRTVLGMFWSVLSPLCQLLIMSIVFTRFFGADMPHFTVYLFAGNIIFSFFSQATKDGMVSLVTNSSVITKINVPKYLFLLSKNVSGCINFLITIPIFFLFCIIDGVHFSWEFFMLIFPVLCLIMFNIGVGFILSALYVFFKDIQYLYDIFTMLLMYLSAIFYPITAFSPQVQTLFKCNPVYVYIDYFRQIVIHNQIPSLNYHLLCMFYAFVVVIIGMLIYKKFNYKFIYYLA